MIEADLWLRTEAMNFALYGKKNRLKTLLMVTYPGRILSSNLYGTTANVLRFQKNKRLIEIVQKYQSNHVKYRLLDLKSITKSSFDSFF